MPGMPGGSGFDPGVKPLAWSQTAPEGIHPLYLYLADASTQIEVVYASADAKPRVADLREVWAKRWNKRAASVLLVAGYETPDGRQATVVGLRGQASVGGGPLSAVERAIAHALEATDSKTAEEILEGLLAEHDPDAIPGLHNDGLFATYELQRRVPERLDFRAAGKAVNPVRHVHGVDILTALGWTLTADGSDYLLGSDGRNEAVAVVLEGTEVFARSSAKFGGSTPVEHALAVAHRHRVTWVLAVKGTVVRLYSADPDTGIARKGTTTHTQFDLALLPEDHLGYVGLLLTPAALGHGGTVLQILASSKDHAAELGARLRDRIYTEVIPELAEIVADQLDARTQTDLEHAYHVTLVILFRLLFVAYAEDRELLPYHSNRTYRAVALKTRARRYAQEIADGNTRGPEPTAVDIWDDLASIWSAVFHGHREWSIPAYGGSLFDPDDPIGKAISRLRLTNDEISPALEYLLVDTGPDGTEGPVDFQTLSVREFGTIYEGLLESSLSVAPTDLTLDAKSAYVPAGKGDTIYASDGSVYFHNASGVRKATGSYFTKEFAVEHLLRRALDPSVDEHLDHVRALVADGRDAAAASALFDFRAADLAMGSGHFLIGAIDHIATRFAAFLDEHPIAHATVELQELLAAAVDALTAAGVPDEPTITPTDLIRRQVARRCIYGIDINRIAVDLARLAVWIHTFIPGLPMSTLDHGLVVGNSLTGIGTLDEALDVLEPEAKPGQHSLFRQQIEDGIAAAAAPLRRVALLSEATVAQSREAAKLIAEARGAVEPTRLVLDAAVAGRLGLIDLRLATIRGWGALVDAGSRPEVQKAIDNLDALHFPIAFPEVFQRARPGFDVILGNPPWDKVHIEKHQWWGLRLPGIRSLPTGKMEKAIDEFRGLRPDLEAEYEADIKEADTMREALAVGPFPGVGRGHIDLYKAFCWRDWSLLRDAGRAGVVFPRGALSGSGTARWREQILAHGTFDDVCFLTNTKLWVFDEVHPQYTVALTTIRRGGDRVVTLNGPFHSLADYRFGVDRRLAAPADEFATWATGAAFPLLPSNDSAAVFAKLRSQPRFDSKQGFEFRPVQGDLNATADKGLLDFTDSWVAHRIPVLAGASFNLWSPDFGAPYAHARRKELLAHLQNKRQRQARTSSSAFYGMDVRSPSTLPIHQARIAFRDVARATDTRTVIASLLSPMVSFTHKAPYLLRRIGSPSDEAYTLGVMSSIPFDWYARRFVEITLSFEILSPFPLARPPAESPLRRRVVEIAARLAAVDDRYADWAAEVGVKTGSVTDEATKTDLIAELDAVVSHLYELERGDVAHIFETFHRGWAFEPRLAAVLQHFDRWAAEK